MRLLEILFHPDVVEGMKKASLKMSSRTFLLNSQMPVLNPGPSHQSPARVRVRASVLYGL